MRLRQEVVNVVLAELLQEGGLTAVPEQIIRAAASGEARLPDVIVDFQGLRLAVEGEFETTPDAERKATRKAAERVEDGLAHVGIGVVYPAHLSTCDFADLHDRLSRARFRFAIATELPEAPAAVEGTVQDLGEALRRAYGALVEDEALSRAVAVLEVAIDRYVTALHGQSATPLRFAKTLGIQEAPDSDGGGRDEALTPAQQGAVVRIAALVLVNAMIFQEILSGSDQRVRSLRGGLGDQGIAGELAAHWGFILDDINYYPIFHIARELLVASTASRDVSVALSSLADAALRIVEWRAALRHDLMGRVYHRLLAEAKYLGAYYTSVPAAVLLLKLALSRDSGSPDWSDLQSVSGFRVADLACGTGTLLMAAADAIADNHVRDCVARHRPPQMDDLQSLLLGEVIWGFDVLPSALHLTASTLALRIPEIPVNVTNLYSLPLGGRYHRLGTLEFLHSDTLGRIAPLFGAPTLPERVVGRGAPEEGSVQLPPLDLCVMNPPFTRSVGGNLLFGNFPAKDREKMQRRLQAGLKKPPARVGGGAKGLSASITAGLGSVFVALADRRVKPGGRLAVVLPQGLLSGVAWSKTRDLVGKGYQVEYLIVSHEPDHWNFSENTNLSECLTVARKRRNEANQASPVVCVNLWRNPRNPIEALAVARQLGEGRAPDVLTEQGALQLVVGNTKMGEAVAVPQKVLQDGLWQFGCAYAQSELVRAFMHVLNGRLYLPGEGDCGGIPLVPLASLAALGPDRRDVHDGFEESSGETPFPALWGHDSERITTLNQVPNRHLSPRAAPKPGRHLRMAHHLWPRAGRLLIAEKLWLNTDRLVAVHLPTPALSNVWWPTRLNHRGEEAEQIAALWLNSTLGLLVLLAHREETRGAWVQFKKPTLGSLPVLDLGALDARRRRALRVCFEQVADLSLASLPSMDDDPVRSLIDRAISKALGLPDLGVLRALLAREPILTLDPDRLTRHPY